MKLTKPVYKVVGRGKTKGIVVQYACRTMFSHALNFSSFGWMDHSFQLVKNILSKHDVIFTDTDLIAHDDYIERIREGSLVVLAYTKDSNKVGANKIRLRKAYEKLTARGIKARYFADETKALAFIDKLK